MARGQKIGGHVAGTPNRKTQEMSALLESLGCNPIEGMAPSGPSKAGIVLGALSDINAEVCQNHLV